MDVATGTPRVLQRVEIDEHPAAQHKVVGRWIENLNLSADSETETASVELENPDPLEGEHNQGMETGC